MYRFLVAALLSMLMLVGYILLLDYYTHAQHRKQLSESFRLNQEHQHQGMLQLCKTYREWQQLTDPTDNITGMDPICEQHEKMIH
jgi:hypothetical protein